jgi:hypothetical protein
MAATHATALAAGGSFGRDEPAAPMAATVATAKIVLRIMGLSWFLLDVFSHPACQSGD